MNKKFFTLIAGVAMLAGLVGTANAQGVDAGVPLGSLPKADGGKYLYQLFVNQGGSKGDPISDGTGGTPASQILSVDAKGILHLDDYTTFDRPYGESLWCADFTEWDFDGAYGAGLTFTNRASQRYLMTAVEDSYYDNAYDSINVNLGSQFTWGFSSIYNVNIEQGMPLYSYFGQGDSVLVLLSDPGFAAHTPPATGTSTDGSSLFVARIAANDFFTGVQTGWTGASAKFYNSDNNGTDLSDYLLYFTIVKPAPILLTAEGFNTLLQTKKETASALNYNKLTFTQDSVNVKWANPWSAFELRATDVPALDVQRVYNAASIIPSSSALTSPWLKFNTRGDMRPAIAGNQQWLRVDTVYADQKTQYLTFNFGTAADINPAARNIEGQYYFRLAYNVYNDSLGIDVMQARYVTIDPAAPASEKYFNSATPLTWDGYDDKLNPGSISEIYSYPDNSANWLDADYLHVGLVDIDGNKTRLITLRTPPVFTYAQLGVKGCLNDNLFDSIDEGLYVIVNNGLALGVPINTDSLNWQNSVYPPVFTNLYGIQDPQQMPSYQWVVKKLRKSRAELSPVVLINREFPNIRYTPVQLLKNNGKVTIDEYHRPNIQVQKNYFIKVEKKYSEDKKLGYFYIDDRTARLSSYDLNYLHNFAADRYLGVGAAGKSNGLSIQTEPYQWTFEPVTYNVDKTASVKYGYAPSKDDTEKLFISHLERTAYTIKSGSNLLFIDDQKTYVSTPASGTSSLIPDTTAGICDYGIFLIKTHNTKDGKNYYALLDTNSYYGRPQGWSQSPVTYNGNATVDYGAAGNITPLQISYTKVGIADGSVVAYAQPQDEVRTSAFHIGVYHAPLYRRFDGGEYTYGNGPAKVNEVYRGDDTTDVNSPLYLKFHDIIQDWMSLYENSSEGNKFRSELSDKAISFLGLQDTVHFPAGDPAYNKPYYSFYVDTAYVKRTVDGKGGPTVSPDEYTPMPQYMLVLRPEIRKAGVIYSAGADSTWYIDENGNKVPLDETHWADTVPKKVNHLVRGMYLFNAQDSINRGKFDYRGKLADNIENDVRLAFVDGVHLGDTFYVLPASYKNRSAFYFQTEPERWLYNLPWWKKHYLGENTHYVPRWYDPYTNDDARNASALPNTATYDSNGNEVYPNGKSMVFQFRLRNVGQKGGNPKRDFYIESVVVPLVANNNEIGPHKALFINNHNGAPIISKDVDFPAGVINNEGALGLNVVKPSADDPKATANEAAATAAPKVIGGAGSVTILNAAGKTITVTNVLGQTIATSVATGNSQTIALPKGIVVVSIDGASAKALVK